MGGMGIDTKDNTTTHRVRRLYRDGFTIGRFEIGPTEFNGFLTILPVIILYFFIAILPMAFAFWASFHRVPLLNPVWTWVGLENYVEILGNALFWDSLWRGIIYMVASTILQTVIGIWMALVLNQIERGERIISSFVFSAYLTPTIIVVLISLFALDPYIGIAHIVGAEWLGLWDGYLLGNTSDAMPAVILIGTWKFSVFITIFTFAQLRSIPDEHYEAAKICGASMIEMFRDITLPRIKGVLAVAVLLRSIFMFNKFDVIWPLTQGGPGFSTTTLPILAYQRTFQGSSYGEGNTIAVVMFIFLVAGGIAYFAAFNPAEEVKHEH